MSKLLASSKNDTLLRTFYDSAYVHRLELADLTTPVQVCVDTRMLGVNGTGVATYAAVLANCLRRAGAAPMLLSDAAPGDASASRSRMRRWGAAARPGNRAVDHAGVSDGGAHASVFRTDVFREAQVYFNLHRELMPVVCSRPPRVMHWTYPVPLYLVGAHNIYTLHDAIPLTHPELTPISRQRHIRLLDRIQARATRLLTVSETARGEIVKALGCRAEQVTALLQGVHLPLQRDPALPAGARAGRYFLFCGTIEPRKNCVALARAHTASGTPYPLLIVGPQGWRAPEILKELAGMPNVRVLPWQERPTLIALMRNARALLLPTLAEGFGLPIAEAMALGTPVLTSSHTATAEVAGAAALLVDPRDLGALTQAIGRLSVDDMLLTRLRATGFARASHFSLDAYAQRLRHFYGELAALPNASSDRLGDST